MVRIAVCDDNISELTRVAALLGQYREAHAPALHYDVFQSAMELLEAMRQTTYDVLILDILMPGVTGMQAAREIRSFDEAAHIVFLTSSPEFAVESYAVDADSYLLKPCTAEKLFPVLDRAVNNLQYRQRAVLVTSPDGDVKVSLADICYVESENVHVAVHTVSGVYRSRIALAKFAEQLDETFIKVHRSYIVGLKYIKKISRNDITMLNGDVLPISRGMYDAIHAALIKYL